MARRICTIPRFEYSNGTLILLNIRITLVDSDHNPLLSIGVDADDPITGVIDITSGNSSQSIELTVTEDISPTSLYKVEVFNSEIQKEYFVPVPSGAGALSWTDFVSGGDPIDPADLGILQVHVIDTDLHLSTDERASLSAANAPDAGNAIATMDDVAGGGGGNVSRLGTPLVNQIAVFASEFIIGSSAAFTFNGTVLSITGNITISGTIDGRNVATDGTKLDGIEASADVTDEVNVLSALDGATISEVASESGDFFLFQDTSDSGAIKKIDHDNLPGGGGGGLSNIVEDTTPQLGGDLDLNSNSITGIGSVNITGNIALSGTVDSRDIAADGTKLDSIENAATADQSNAEIKTAYEANADTNEFSDAEQTLLGNQSGTNTGDEAAASDTTAGIVELATIAEVNTGTDASRAITPDALEGSDLQIKVDGVETGATADQSNAEIKTAYEANADTNEFSDAEQTKLSGIEASADITDETNVLSALDGATITEITAISGDFFLFQDTSDAGNLKKVAYDDLPGAAGGLSNIVEDDTPQLGGQLDVNGQAIGNGTLELVTFVEDASAVNHIEIENEATGSGPIIRAVGDDTNIDLNLLPKGSGAINVGSRDIEVDGAKLDGIESNATADQTGAEIKTAYENEADTNAFTDAEQTLLGNQSGTNTGDEAAASPTVAGVVELATIAEVNTGTDTTRAINPDALKGSDLQIKVDGIEASADVTDEANVLIALDGATISEITAVSGDFFLFQDTTDSGNIKKVNYDDLPGAAGGLSNVVEDVTPQLGGQLDINGEAIGDGTRELLTFVEDGSAVNQIEIENEATGSGPILRSAGDDTNIDLNLGAKGSGAVIVDGRGVAVDGAKLDGIEASATADQTGAEIKTAYENETNTNAFTDAEKTLLGNQSGTNTGDEAAASDTVAGIVELATIAEVNTGTATDRAVTPDALEGSDLQIKVDGIEAGATTDQSNAEIKTAYESNADTNEFSDSEKTLLGNQSGTNTGDEPTASDTIAGIIELATIAEVDTGTAVDRAITPDALEGSALQIKVDGIEANADITDTTNVAAAGALMDSEVDADLQTFILPANTTISAFGATLVDDAAASNARTTLGLGTAAVVATDLADLNEATIEAAIDTLANLTSVQGFTVTLADAAADALFGWDDTAGAYENLTAAEVRAIINVEDGADVTDTTNVTAAGAFMDSENLPVNQLNSGTGASASTFWRGDGTWAIPAGLGDVVKVGTPVNNQIGIWTGDGTLEGDAALTFNGTAFALTGNMTVSGTVDGRDLATDGTKLDGVESGATADQTAGEIKTAYESNADTNEFSDAEQTLLGNQSGTNTGDEAAASTTVAGVVELATIAEVDTGTAVDRAITPDALEGSALQIKVDGVEDNATNDLFTATNNNGGSITIGMVVYVDGSGTVDLARANAASTDRAIGLVKDASISAAASGNFNHRGVLTSSDWTAVIGTTNLTAGADYFLSPDVAGGLETPASAVTTEFVVYVGHAISTTSMLISIERPVGL